MKFLRAPILKNMCEWLLLEVPWFTLRKLISEIKTFGFMFGYF